MLKISILDQAICADFGRAEVISAAWPIREPTVYHGFNEAGLLDASCKSHGGYGFYTLERKIPAATIESLKWKHMKSWKKGAIIGAAVGTAAGIGFGTAGYLELRDSNWGSPGIVYAGIPVFALVGAVIGAGIGAGIDASSSR